MNFSLIVKPQAEDVVRAAAQRWVEAARESIAARGRFVVALAGGSTPRALYELLAGEPFRARLDWEKTHVLFGDERAVPPDSEHSNARMARRALLDHVPLPAANIHLMRGGDPDLNAAAHNYGRLVRDLETNGVALDLALLGMGPDGHTASLFPGTPALNETQHRCVATGVAPLEPHVARLTLTFPVFNAARRVLVLVTGEGKAERVTQALSNLKNDAPEIDNLPISGVRPTTGELLWLLDAGAARELDRETVR